MILPIVQAFTDEFRARCHAAEFVCVGDSITGWNNFGPPATWPFPTYPTFLDARLNRAGDRLRCLGNAGVAGEVSDNGLSLTQRSLRWFPAARVFVIGFGTNDLAVGADLDVTSRRILANLTAMLEAVRSAGRLPLLLDVPPINESAVSDPMAREARERRAFHNRQLGEFCERLDVPLIHIHDALHDRHFGDPLHPNAEGAEQIAEQVFARLVGLQLG